MHRIFSLGLCTVVTIFSLSAGGAELKSQPNQSPNATGRDAVISMHASVPAVFNHIAVGNFDDVNTPGAVMSFPGLGVWKYSAGSWSRLSTDCAEELVAVYSTATRWGSDMIARIAGDFGDKGLWLWQDGSWSQLSPDDAEYITTHDFDYDLEDELFCDFGGLGLWYWNGGSWLQMNAANPDYCAVQDRSLNHDAYHALTVDFGPGGMQYLIFDLYGPPLSFQWTQLNSLNPDFFLCDGLFHNDLAVDFGALGLWVTDWHTWVQLSGLDAESMIPGDSYSAVTDIVVDFGTAGLWLWNGSAWTELSGADAGYLISWNVDGDTDVELIVDFGPIGLWEYDSGVWNQLSGADAENIVSGDFDGDAQVEGMVDFGTLGLWLWDSGVWTQISSENPD